MACCYPSSIADTPRSPLVYGIFDCPRGEKKNLGKKPRKIVKSPAAFVVFGTYLCFEQKYNSYWTQVYQSRGESGLGVEGWRVARGA